MCEIRRYEELSLEAKRGDPHLCRASLILSRDSKVLNAWKIRWSERPAF